MKINIKDVFEKEEKNVHVPTNDRLDIDEVFAEAKAEAEAEAEKDAEEPDVAAEPAEESVEESVEAGGEEAPEMVEESDGGKDAESELALETERSDAHEADVGDASDEEGAPEEGEQPDVTESSEPEAAGSEEPEAEQPDEAETAEPEAEELPDADDTSDGEETAEEAEPETSTESGGSAADEDSEAPEAADTAKALEAAEASEAPEALEAAEATEAAEASETLAAASDAGQPFYKRYLTQGAIAAAFVILLIVVCAYNTMVPREVNATINGEEFTFSSKAHTVELFLEDEGIEFGSRDYISTPLETFIYDGIELEIRHATDFKITADGKTRDYESLANTVGEALADVGIKIGDDDIVTPKADALLEEDMEIVVQRVVIKEEVVEETVPFETVEKNDSSMNEGTRKVVTKGSDGKDEVTYRVTYIDGKEKSRKEIDRVTVTKAVDKVIANGTRINYNGQTYSRKLVVKAYAYTGGGRTAMGTSARVGEIAVDPSVIPLGTNVYIEGVGARRAEDTGGNIKGNTIDIYMNSESECLNWGVRYVTIYIQ